MTGETVDLSQCQSVPDKEAAEEKASEVRMKENMKICICNMHTVL